jgi:oligoendopeptidase F
MKTFAICAAAILLSTASAAEPYRLDFTRIFASPEAEKADRAALARELDALQAMRGTVASDGDHLLLALQRNDAVQTKLARHAMYLYLRYAVDTRDERSRDEGEALYADVAAKSAFLNDEIMAIGDVRLAQLIAAQPKLETYRYAIQSIRRWRPHTLSEPEEKLLAMTAPSSLNWQFDLYEKAKGNRDLTAFALTRLADARNAYARLRHFAGAAEWSYFERSLTRAEVDAMLARVAASAALYKRYQQLRAARPRPAAPPKFTIDEARQMILEAAAPLGAEYTAQLRALLDPANGRLDILPGPNRKRGGFSEGALGVDSVFYSGGFTGTYNDVRMLAHESAHAVQRQLMNANGVPMAYRSGASYIAESLAIVCELLLADHMARRTGDTFYLEQFLDGKGMAAFAVAPEAELEEAVYDGAGRTPDELDALTARVYERYTIGTPKERWMSIPLMYEDPFYDVNYVYGAIVGLRIYARLGRDPSAFVALMKNGYDAPPAALLQRFFGIALDAPIDDVVQLLTARVEAYAR